MDELQVGLGETPLSPSHLPESREQGQEYGIDDAPVPMLPFDEPLSEGDARELGDDDPLARHGEEAPFTEFFAGAGKAYLGGKTFMDAFWEDKYSAMRTENIFYPFASRNDWQFASWLTRSGLSMAAIDSLLSLELVSLSIVGWYVQQTNCNLRSRTFPFLSGQRDNYDRE